MIAIPGGSDAAETLTRAARDLADDRPTLAAEARFLGLHRLVNGYGYEITSEDVWAAFESAIQVAEKRGAAGALRARIKQLLADDPRGFVARILGPVVKG